MDIGSDFGKGVQVRQPGDGLAAGFKYLGNIHPTDEPTYRGAVAAICRGGLSNEDTRLLLDALVPAEFRCSAGRPHASRERAFNCGGCCG